MDEQKILTPEETRDKELFEYEMTEVRRNFDEKFRELPKAIKIIIPKHEVNINFDGISDIDDSVIAVMISADSPNIKLEPIVEEYKQLAETNQLHIPENPLLDIDIKLDELMLNLEKHIKFTDITSMKINIKKMPDYSSNINHDAFLKIVPPTISSHLLGRIKISGGNIPKDLFDNSMNLSINGIHVNKIAQYETNPDMHKTSNFEVEYVTFQYHTQLKMIETGESIQSNVVQARQSDFAYLKINPMENFSPTAGVKFSEIRNINTTVSTSLEIPLPLHYIPPKKFDVLADWKQMGGADALITDELSN